MPIIICPFGERRVSQFLPDRRSTFRKCRVAGGIVVATVVWLSELTIVCHPCHRRPGGFAAIPFWAAAVPITRVVAAGCWMLDTAWCCCCRWMLHVAAVAVAAAAARTKDQDGSSRHLWTGQCNYLGAECKCSTLYVRKRETGHSP